MAQVCPSCPGVCVRRWFGVSAFAWCECFLGSCVLSLGVGALPSRLVDVPAALCECRGHSKHSGELIRRDPLAQCGHTRRGARWLIWRPSLPNVPRNVMAHRIPFLPPTFRVQLSVARWRPAQGWQRLPRRIHNDSLSSVSTGSKPTFSFVAV